jgi:hypothetical protein
MSEGEKIVARFDLQEWATHCIDEDAFGENYANAREIASEVESPFGHLFVEATGRPTLKLADDLLPLASNLGRTMDELRDNGRAELAAFSQPFEWLLVREGDEIQITADEEPPQRYPAQELEQALAACRERMVAALKQLTPTDPDWQSKTEGL